MMPVRAMRSVLAIILILSAGSVFASHQALAQTPLAITIGYQSTANWLLFVARDHKLFEKAGLAPAWVKFDGGVSDI